MPRGIRSVERLVVAILIARLLSVQSLDASRPWLVYWITQSLYLLDEQLTDGYIDE